MKWRLEEMISVFHLDVATHGEDAWDLKNEISFAEHEPTAEEFAHFYEKVGEDDVETIEIGEVLSAIWARWNAGSGQECKQFTARECTSCDRSFVAFMGGRGRDFENRQMRVEQHESVTGHTVEAGIRSLMAGDVVVVDGAAYLCKPFGWGEMEHLDVTNEGGGDGISC